MPGRGENLTTPAWMNTAAPGGQSDMRSFDRDRRRSRSRSRSRDRRDSRRSRSRSRSRERRHRSPPSQYHDRDRRPNDRWEDQRRYSPRRDVRPPPHHEAPPEMFSIHPGKIRMVKEFGVFVSMEAYRRGGLVHISQLASRRVDVSEIADNFGEGLDVFVKVIGVEEGDPGGPKIKLSMKYVNQSTGKDLDAENEEFFASNTQSNNPRRDGQPPFRQETKPPEMFSIHPGKIRMVKEFGVFVSMEAYRRGGLVHISQLATWRVDASEINEKFEEGLDVFVKVIGCEEGDPGGPKIKLSMKYCCQATGKDLDAENEEFFASNTRSNNRKAGNGDPTDRKAEINRNIAMQVHEYGHRKGASDYDLIPEPELERQPADVANPNMVPLNNVLNKRGMTALNAPAHQLLLGQEDDDSNFGPITSLEQAKAILLLAGEGDGKLHKEKKHHKHKHKHKKHKSSSKHKHKHKHGKDKDKHKHKSSGNKESSSSSSSSSRNH